MKNFKNISLFILMASLIVPAFANQPEAVNEPVLIGLSDFYLVNTEFDEYVTNEEAEKDKRSVVGATVCFVLGCGAYMYATWDEPFRGSSSDLGGDGGAIFSGSVAALLWMLTNECHYWLSGVKGKAAVQKEKLKTILKNLRLHGVHLDIKI